MVQKIVPRNSNIVLTMDEELHQYYADGALVPGVNRILNVIHKYPEGDARPRRLIDAAFFGKVVHRVCELEDRGTLDESSVHQKVVPYLDGYRLFKKDFHINKEDIFLNEEMLISVDLGVRFCGTLDRKVFEFIFDIKTSADHSQMTKYQLAGYEILYNENYPDYQCHRRLEVLLRQDGTYIPLWHKDPGDRNIFISSLNVYNVKMSHGFLQGFSL
jgi:hypothetical protein